jgi:hypothetical protein
MKTVTELNFIVEPREVHVLFILVFDLYQHFGFPESVVTASLAEWVGMAATLYTCISGVLGLNLVQDTKLS